MASRMMKTLKDRLPVLNQRMNTDLSETESMAHVARIACSHAKMFENCLFSRCRRYRRCHGFYFETEKQKQVFPHCPPCVQTNSDRDKVIIRVQAIVDDGGKKDGEMQFLVLSHKVPPRHRSRQ